MQLHAAGNCLPKKTEASSMQSSAKESSTISSPHEAPIGSYKHSMHDSMLLHHNRHHSQVHKSSHHLVLLPIVSCLARVKPNPSAHTSMHLLTLPHSEAAMVAS
jgi:hypothetical protein